MLIDTAPIFKEVSELAQAIDVNWRSIAIPVSLKVQFAELWKSQIGYPAEVSSGQIKLFTSTDNAEYVADVALAKAICAYPLRKALHDYRNAVIQLKVDKKIESFEEEFKEKRVDPPPSWSQWKDAIDGSALTVREKELLQLFLCDSKAFNGIKGIAREDFAAPAVIKAIGHRVDRFGIADQIACVTNQALSEAIVALVRRGESLGDTRSQVIGFGAEFEAALRLNGFGTYASDS